MGGEQAESLFLRFNLSSLLNCAKNCLKAISTLMNDSNGIGNQANYSIDQHSTVTLVGPRGWNTIIPL